MEHWSVQLRHNLRSLNHLVVGSISIGEYEKIYVNYRLRRQVFEQGSFKKKVFEQGKY